MAEPRACKSFAEQQLAKFGWKKGMGLGRLNDGIAEPLRVKVHADKSGIGHDAKKDFSDWWDDAYNKALNCVTVVYKDGCVEVKKTKDDSSICVSKPNVCKSSLLYGNFIQKGTLTGDTYQAHISDSENEMDDETPAAMGSPGDGLLFNKACDQLFKLYGYSTAHRGARMTAKMKRCAAMEQNEAKLVADWKLKEEQNQASKTRIDKLATLPIKLWKNRTTSTKASIAYQYEDCNAEGEAIIRNCDSLSDNTEDSNCPKKQKKKKTKKDKRNPETDGRLPKRGDEENELSSTESRRKKRRTEITLEGPEDLTCDKPKQKKKKHEHQKDENSPCTAQENLKMEVKDPCQKFELKNNIFGSEDESITNEIKYSSVTVNSSNREDLQDSSNYKNKRKTKKKKNRTKSQDIV